MISKVEPAIWLGETDQRIPSFNWCQLTTTISKMYAVIRTPHAWLNLLAGVWPPCYLTLSFFAWHMGLQYLSLAMLTMKKELHGFLKFRGWNSAIRNEVSLYKIKLQFVQLLNSPLPLVNTLFAIHSPSPPLSIFPVQLPHKKEATIR